MYGVPDSCPSRYEIRQYWCPTAVHQHGGTILGSEKFARNILANMSALGQRTSLKLRELSSLFIFYNITIS